MGQNPPFAHVRIRILRAQYWVAAGLLWAAVLLVTGCGETTELPPPPPPPPAGQTQASTPPPGPGRPPAVPLPDSKLPPVAWLELDRAPDLEACDFSAAELATHRLIVVAVPIAAFPTLQQGDHQFRQALFQDWALIPFDPTGGKGEFGPEAIACRAAVASLQGQFSYATQFDPKTKLPYLRSASVTGNADAIHLLFVVPKAAAPFTVLYQKKPVYVCTPEANAAMLNRLFLPKRPPNRWQEARIDLTGAPLVLTHFGSCVEIRRERFLMARQNGGEPATIKPAAGKVFFAFQFAPLPAGFDYKQADWHLTLADTTTLEPVAVSANGGKDYLHAIALATAFSGGETTTPVILFEVADKGTPVRLQHQTQVVNLPK